MLMSMRSQVEATRALAYVVGAAHDAAVHHPDPEVKKQNQAFVDLMIPVVRAGAPKSASRLRRPACAGPGGMGFIEKPALRSTCATCVSRPSTKAPPASRPTT